MGYEEVLPVYVCPKCGQPQMDFDGFGLLACLGIKEGTCDYCTHPSITEGVCTICEKEIPDSRLAGA